MSWINNIFQRREAAPSTGTATTPQVKEQGNTGSYKDREVHINRPEQSLTVSAVYRAVELKAKTLGSMEMQYQRKDSAKGNFTANMYGDGRVLNWLLQKRANPLMTGSELFQQMSIHRELLGNAFVYIERDDRGAPMNLWLALCGGYNPMNNTYTLTWNTDHGVV